VEKEGEKSRSFLAIAWGKKKVVSMWIHDGGRRGERGEKKKKEEGSSRRKQGKTFRSHRWDQGGKKSNVPRTYTLRTAMLKGVKPRKGGKKCFRGGGGEKDGPHSLTKQIGEKGGGGGEKEVLLAFIKKKKPSPPRTMRHSGGGEHEEEKKKSRISPYGIVRHSLALFPRGAPE